MLAFDLHYLSVRERHFAKQTLMAEESLRGGISWSHLKGAAGNESAGRFSLSGRSAEDLSLFMGTRGRVEGKGRGSEREHKGVSLIDRS